MKKWVLAITIVGVATVPGFSVAREGESHGGQEHGGATQVVTGEVVDLACYLAEGLKGPGHLDCAQKCIASGLPVGILSGDTVYLAMGSEHGPANQTLAPLAAKSVTAEGTVTERNGVHLIAIKKVSVKESGAAGPASPAAGSGAGQPHGDGEHRH